MSKTCTWCKKHNPGKSEGHTWNECLRLSKLNQEKQEKQINKEVNIIMETEVRNNSFYFDTACTSHMTPYVGGLPNYSKCSRFVKSSSQGSMEIVGKGNVIMECVLRDGSVSSFRVCDVLHVPMLGHSLISWRKLRTEGYSEFEEGDFISINTGTKVMFKAVFDWDLFKIPEISQSAHITYDFWHQALGHLALSSMDKALKLYSDVNIPAKQKEYICSSCVKSKMVKGPRLPTSRKDRKKLGPLHSELSRPLPVPS